MSETTEETKAPARAKANTTTSQRASAKPTVTEDTNVKTPSDQAFHLIILGSLLALAVAGTSWLNSQGLLGSSQAKVHDLELQQQAYRDGIRDVRH